MYGLDALFHRAFGVLIPRPIRLLILKDLRTFRRDPTQWSQFLIFFGLLAFYFTNIRRLGYDVQSPYFRNLLSFLNLSVTALILSTFTSRFIFPMLSLEGRSFWVLGLLPVQRESILWGKFAFASGISLVVTEALIVLSDLMLKMGPAMIALHMVMVAILCLGLSGISVGLGARLPNFREEDPSKIAAGFGGTLNLLVSLVFIAIVVAAIALPCHLYFAGRDFDNSQIAEISLGQFRSWLTGAILLSILVGAVATVLPLRSGSRPSARWNSERDSSSDGSPGVTPARAGVAARPRARGVGISAASARASAAVRASSAAVRASSAAAARRRRHREPRIARHSRRSPRRSGVLEADPARADGQPEAHRLEPEPAPVIQGASSRSRPG
jgi:hypothetical protein